MAVSAYPGLGGFTPYTLPANYLSEALTATGTSRPLVVSETGYGDSTVLFTPGSPKMQRDYFAWLVEEADSLGIEQITWFFPANIWAIYEVAQTPVVLFFTPMGLRTRYLQPKPVLAAWDSAYGRPYTP